jgi:hypothetical protein
MKTDDLINILSQSPQPKAPLSLKAALLLVLLGSTIVTLSVLGLRPDLAYITADLTALHKTILLASILWVTGWALINSAKPLSGEKNSKICPWLLVGLFGGSVAFEWLTTPFNEILPLFLLPSFSVCLTAVTLYGAVGAVFLTWLMKSYAPAHEKKTSLLIGLASAGAGALGYSIHCAVDSPTFITIAYGLPVLTISVVTGLLAPRFIKW